MESQGVVEKTMEQYEYQISQQAMQIQALRDTMQGLAGQEGGEQTLVIEDHNHYLQMMEAQAVSIEQILHGYSQMGVSNNQEDISQEANSL